MLDNIIEMKQIEVGLFRLPGVLFDKGKLSAEKIQEMDEWANSTAGVGTRLTTELWSFKTVAQRDWFILKWCDEVNREQE